MNMYFRPYWRCYYSNTDAIIYVVDSMDRDRIGISKQELVSMLEVGYIMRACCLAKLSSIYVGLQLMWNFYCMAVMFK